MTSMRPTDGRTLRCRYGKASKTIIVNDGRLGSNHGGGLPGNTASGTMLPATTILRKNSTCIRLDTKAGKQTQGEDTPLSDMDRGEITREAMEVLVPGGKLRKKGTITVEL